MGDILNTNYIRGIFETRIILMLISDYATKIWSSILLMSHMHAYIRVWILSSEAPHQLCILAIPEVSPKRNCLYNAKEMQTLTYIW